MRLKKTSYFLFLTIIMIISVFSQTFLVANIQGTNNGITTTQLISENNNIKKVGQYDSGGEVVGVAIHNNYAFLADQVKGLVVIDITNPVNPIYVNEYQAEGESVYDVKIIDDIAYVAHGRAGLRIL
ncbi:unnamed protein product, partial [marine sediment metagenome]